MRRAPVQLVSALAAAAGLGHAAALDWAAGPGYRSAPVAPQGAGPGFASLTPSATGLEFTNVLSERLVALNRVTENGSGVALGDVDGDGWCDIYFCGLEGDNALFKNLGNWRFTNIAARAGVACAGDLSTGAALADTDGDGDLDLLVNAIGGGTRAFFNDGAGRFTEQAGTRLVRRFGSTSLALGDIDGDTDLDLYVANYRTITFDDELPKPKLEARLENGKIEVSPPGRFAAIPAGRGGAEIFELAERDFLYINTGQGVFAPVSWTNGNFLDERGQKLAEAPLDWGLSAMIRDLNGDFLADILVCNDFFNSPDQIWLQQPGLRFQNAGREAFPKFSLASMAVDVADVNRDGLDDIFFAEMLSRDHAFRQTHRDNMMKAVFNGQMPDPLFRPETPRNTLFLNRGDGTYAEIAELAGVDASEWSWGVQFLDVDLDGYEDLLVPTGHNHDVQEADALRVIRQTRAADSIPARLANLQRLPKLLTPILAFRNEHPEPRFREAQERWGLDIPGVANGLAAADLDNDGDLDLVCNRLNGPALLLRNQSPAPRIGVRLRGAGANSHGIGAKIVVLGGAVPRQSQTMLSGGRYLSCNDTMRVFAASPAGRPLAVEVQWPDRTRDVFTNLLGNRIYEFAQRGAAGAVTSAPPEKTWFADASAALGHRDSDPPFDDWQRQPTLPSKLSSQGPALAWSDANGDGLEDLIVGAGRGGSIRFLQNTGTGFVPMTNTIPAFPDDVAGLLHAPVFGSEPLLLAALGNYESGSARQASVHGQNSSTNFALAGEASTAGALALADIDGDGDLDLFVGGRVLPGRYPSPASSRIFKNTGREFVPDEVNNQTLAHCGLVASACFADLDNDGWPDLVTPLEWGELRIWRNREGKLERREAGLGAHTGLWTGVAAADFDNDGRIDLAVGNWGRNTRHERFLGQPLRAYYGDLDGNGVHDLLEAIHDPRLKQYAPILSLEMLRQSLPALAERFQTFADYSQASVDTILSGRPAAMLEASTLASAVFLNRGSSFEPRPLPVEAQFAPIFGLAAADFDGDGHEDLAAAQNLFDTRWDTGRLDSGRPILLRGDGRGNFEVAPFARSGLRGGGQGRAVAAADYNRDGRVDLAVSQNNDETKLFENRTAAPGVRLRFEGPPGNSAAIGARYRVLDRQSGPAREIQCGAGWLAQHSRVQVARRPSAEARLFVRWSPSRETEFPIPAGARELLVAPGGITKIE